MPPKTISFILFKDCIHEISFSSEAVIKKIRTKSSHIAKMVWSCVKLQKILFFCYIQGMVPQKMLRTHELKISIFGRKKIQFETALDFIKCLRQIKYIYFLLIKTRDICTMYCGENVLVFIRYLPIPRIL